MKINNRKVVKNGSFLFLYAFLTSYLPHIGIKIDLRYILILVHLRCLRIDFVRSERYSVNL